MNRKKHEKTCPYCAFMHAASRLYKKHGGERTRADIVRSACKIVHPMFATMTPQEQTRFIKDISAPAPDIGSVMEAVKSAIEALGGGKVKVTEH